MISFCTADNWPFQKQSTPDPFSQLAPATKHASSGPSEVANIPAPHGQCSSLRILIGFPKHVTVLLSPYVAASILRMLFVVITDSSSPGYEIFGIGGTFHLFISFSASSGMQALLQSPTAKILGKPSASLHQT